MGTGQMFPSDTWHSGDLLYNQNSEAHPAKSKSFMLELERVRNPDICVLYKSYNLDGGEFVCLNCVYL